MNKLTQQFVEHLPDQLEEGVLYVSIKFATVAHLCCCGCGNEVITKLSPIDWQMTFDGESISLCPSIGNWSFECNSHYWIKRNEVHWAEYWTRDKIARVQAYQKAQQSSYYDNEPAEKVTKDPPDEEKNPPWFKRVLQQMHSWL